MSCVHRAVTVEERRKEGLEGGERACELERVAEKGEREREISQLQSLGDSCGYPRHPGFRIPSATVLEGPITSNGGWKCNLRSPIPPSLCRSPLSRS